MLDIQLEVQVQLQKINRILFRSFISFSFGGKNIEDFNIIRVTGGERLTDNLYADFEDIVDEYDVLDGQFYWGTHHKPLELNYTLSTDGMTQRQLDEFKAWFAPGKIRQLIRAQHPNRAIMARVSAAPSMNMIPFQGSEQKKIGRVNYEITTTIYKGDISLSLIAEEPYWYSLCNLLGTRKFGRFEGEEIKYYNEIPGTATDEERRQYFPEYVWKNAQGQEIAVLRDEDALKVILQDNIPSANMIQVSNDLFLGDNFKVKVNSQEGKSGSALVSHDTQDDNKEKADGQSDEDFQNDMRNATKSYNPPYAIVGTSVVGGTYAPETQSFDIGGQTDNSISLGGTNSKKAYLYYAGNAPSYPTIKFTLTPVIKESTPPYIKAPGNSYVGDQSSSSRYHSITIEGEKTHQFRFTTPSAWSGYNQAIYWANKMASDHGSSLEDFRVVIRDYVNHWAARAWAIAIIEYFDTNKIEKLVNREPTVGETTYINVTKFYEIMKYFLIDTKGEIYSSDFTFDSKTGKSTGIIKYNILEKKQQQQSTETNGNGNVLSVSDFYEQNTISPEEREENIGDMVRSNYLFLQETSYPDSDGLIVDPVQSNNEQSINPVQPDDGQGANSVQPDDEQSVDPVQSEDEQNANSVQSNNEQGTNSNQSENEQNVDPDQPEDENYIPGSLYTITTNYPGGITNFKIQFKNMYR